MSDQNNQSPINPANIANRKIAQPRRRLQRTASEDTANHSNPMAGFSFGNTAGTTPQQPSAFGMSTGGSPFGAQPQQQQPTTPTLGRSFSAASSFQFNMPQQQQQQLTQQTGTPPPAGGSPLLASTGGFGSGSSTSGSSNSGSFTFGSGATSIPSPQVAFSFGGSPASAANPTSTAGTQPSFSFGTAAASPAPQQQPAFGFGTASSAASTTTSQPAFGFGTSTPAAQSAFGSSSTQQQSNAMEDESMDKDEAPAATRPSGFSFGGSGAFGQTAATSTPTFGFGTVAPQKDTTTSTTASTTTPAPTFSFGTAAPAATSQTPQSTVTSKPAFGFGTTTTAPATSTAPPSFSFTKPTELSESGKTTTSAPATGGFTFGTSSKPATDANKPAMPAFGFGATTKSPATDEATTKEPSTEKQSDKAPSSPFTSKASAFSFSPTTPASTTPAKPLNFSFGSSAQTTPKESADETAKETSKPVEVVASTANLGTATAGGESTVARKDSEEQKVPSSDDKDTAEKSTTATTTTPLLSWDTSATLVEKADHSSGDNKSTADKTTDSDKPGEKSGENWFGGSSKSDEAPQTSSAASASLPTFSITSTASSPEKGKEAPSKGPSPFVFPKATEDKPEGQKTTTPAFSFGKVTPTPSTENKDQPAEVPKPTFSFGTPVSSASNQPSVPTFSFDKSQGLFKEKKASETPASTSTAPKFSFAAPAPAPASSTSPALDKGPSPFNFPANAASTDKPSAEKASTTSSAAATTASSPFGGFSFKTPEASKPATTSSVPAPSPGTAFTFTSTSAEADKPVSTTTSSSTFSFGTEAPLAASKESSSTTSESGRKRKSSDQPSATESSRQKLLHGKSPLSQSWSAEEDNGDAAKKGLSTAGSGSTLVSGLSGAIPTRKRSVDNAGITQTTNAPGKKALTEIQNKENHTTDKHVSFKDTPSSKSSDKSKTASTDKPETISPFKPLQSKPIEIPSSEQASSATKSQSTPKDIFGPPAPTTAEQTTLESKITNPESIEKRTRYRDLPGTAQNELNALSLFITQQMDISKTIETRQSAYNGELIREIDTYADNCAKELRLQRDLHEVTQQNIEALTSTVDYQLKNAMVGQLFFENKNTQGRSKPGTTIHQRYFNDLAASLETRVKEYRSAINQIDERIQTMVDGSLAETTTPEQIPSILKSQSNTLIALAAKVAELHQETEKLKRNCRNITK